MHVAEWVEGEKLSQSDADNVGELVNLGVIVYLTQLLDTGFFHADPHPGNMLRSPDGRLVILDFGLMTEITDSQKFGMIEAIAHLIHRDYERIGDDFVNLEFIPEGVDTAPIVPALARVFDAALAGGGAKSINFQVDPGYNPQTSCLTLNCFPNLHSKTPHLAHPILRTTIHALLRSRRSSRRTSPK